MSALLEVRGLSVRYGHVDALVGVDVSVEEGTITAVLGANGAGKTTLLRAITGLVRPRAGEARLAGEVITGRTPEEVVRCGIAHVPEGRGVIAQLTVEENLKLGSLWRPRRERTIDGAFDLFPNLASRRRQVASTLSGGERQALALARALLAAPRVLLLDEPSLGLAPLVTAQLMARLVELSSVERLTVLLVEQNARTALSIAKRAVVLNLGRVAVDDDAAAIVADGQLRRHFLGF